MARICRHCRQENPDTTETCQACGRSLIDAEVALRPATVSEEEPMTSPHGGLGPPTAPPESSPIATLRDRALGSAGDEPAEETTLWAGRASYKAALGAWLLYAVACVAVLVLLLMFGSPKNYPGPRRFLRVLAWLVILPPGLWLLFKMFYLRWSVGYRLTDQRLFIDRGILGRLTDQTELIRVDDVRVRRSPMQRLTGLGDVIVISTDASDGELTIRSIANPLVVAEHIRTHMRRLRKRSLFVETL